MQRYNLFNLKHKGLRAMLFEAAMSLQHTSFDNADEAAETIRKIDTVIQSFQKHAETENRFVLPVIEKFDPSLVNEFESEHETDEALANDLRCLLNAYKLASDKNVMLATGCEITTAFYDFIAFNLYHMNKEERKINKVLWENYSDKELGNITQSILGSIPPDVMAKDIGWMMRGISNNEIICWLVAVKNSAPHCVFISILSAAEAVLPSKRFTEVQEGLMEGAMIF